MRAFIFWVQGWYETLYIKYRQPELYKALTAPLDGKDYGEVRPPE